MINKSGNLLDKTSFWHYLEIICIKIMRKDYFFSSEIN